MRSVLNEEERRLMPWTMEPFPRRSSARNAPSWPVTPVINATFVLVICLVRALSALALIKSCRGGPDEHGRRPSCDEAASVGPGVDDPLAEDVDHAEAGGSGRDNNRLPTRCMVANSRILSES